MTTLVAIPVLGRPHRIVPLLASLTAATPEPHRVLFVCSPSDQVMIDACRASGRDVHVMAQDWREGDYARKINTALTVSDEPFILTGADDLHFHPGWLRAGLRRFDDPKVGVVGTNDLGSRRVMAGEHATHFLVRRTYALEQGTIDEPGKIFHEGYWHEFVDDEVVGTARHRDAWAMALDSHVEHLHPDWGKAPTDPMYARSGRRQQAGYRLFARRQHLWQTERVRSWM